MVQTRRSTTVQATATTTTTATVLAVQDVVGEPGPSRPRKRAKREEKEAVAYKQVVDEFLDDEIQPLKRNDAAKKKRGKALKAEDTPALLDDPDTKPSKSKAKSKAKAQTYDPSTFLPRSESLWKVGAHVSASGGVENAVVNAAMIGANAFALFLKSQRKWVSPPMEESSASLFKARLKELNYDVKHILPHGSYLINLGNPDTEKRAKSFECFIDDLKRCEALGLKYYNFHPGSTVGQATREESIKFIGESLNEAHRATADVVTVIENMAGAGNIIGSKLEDIRDIITHVEDKARVGVCFDTCHAHAAGYDISTQEGWEKTMTQFAEIIGVKYLVGMHLNDSKTPCGSKRDRHESIGLGTLGLPAFRAILTDPRTQDIPLILETPSFEKPVEVWGVEIGVLNALSSNPVSSTPAAGPGSAAATPSVGDAVVSGKTMDDLVEEVRRAVKGASLGADAKKATAKAASKARAVKGGAKGKAAGKRKRKEEEEESEEGSDHCEEDG